MCLQSIERSILPVAGAVIFLFSGIPARAAGDHLEKHFAVKSRPVVVIHNVANGRIEVKSFKNPQVDVSASQLSNKIGFEMEQVGDRIDVTANILDSAAQPLELEADLQLTVPEETELQLKTETGLIYVEQVMGDMTLESVKGDVHLKEVSGYIFIRTGLYTMKSGKGLVEVRFSGADSFDLNAQTTLGTVDNRAAAFLKPDSHGIKRLASKFTKGFFGTVGQGLAKVELSSYSGTIRILKRD